MDSIFWLAKQLFGVVIVLGGVYLALIGLVDFLGWALVPKPKIGKHAKNGQ